MMKFFRKYNKQLLAVFMALLLLVWLGGDALQSFMRSHYSSAKVIRGQAFGEDVQIQHMMPAYEEAELLDALMGRYWRYPWGHLLHAMGMKDQAAQQMAMQIRSTPLSNDEWYMLDAEARRSHVYVPPEAVERLKKELQLTADHLSMVRNERKRSLEEIDHALQSYLRVQEALVLASNSLKVSEADIRDVVRQTNEKAKIVALLVEAKKFIDDKYQPTDDELKAHFEKYKNATSKPADSGDYGYEVPDAVQLEYIRVNMPPLIARQTVTDEEMYTYWSGHKNEFHKPATQPASTNPASRPAPPQSFATFTEARASVRDKLAKDRAKIESMRIAREVISVLQQPWSTAPATQPDNLKQPPETQTRSDVYDKIVALLDPKYPGVLRPGRTTWLDQNGINRLPDFTRMASMSGTQQEVRLMEAAFLAPGLDARLQENQNRSRFVRNMYETAPEPFVNPDGDALIIRTIGVRPKHPPAGIDEVRERLVADVRRVRALGEAQTMAASIGSRADKEGGLDKVWASDPTLKVKLGDDALHHPQPFSRQQIYGFGGTPEMYPSSVPGLGYDADLSKVVFDMAGAKTTTQPAPIVIRVQSESQRYVVLQFLDILPVTREEYEKARPQALMLTQSQHQIELLTNWFNPDHIKERVGWKEAKEAHSSDSEKPADQQKKS